MHSIRSKYNVNAHFCFDKNSYTLTLSTSIKSFLVLAFNINFGGSHDIGLQFYFNESFQQQRKQIKFQHLKSLLRIGLRNLIQEKKTKIRLSAET